MSETPSSKKPPLSDVDFITFFKLQKEGWIYDYFYNQWENIKLKDFDAVTHFNTLQVYKILIDKRIKYISEIKRISGVSKEKDKKIETLEREKADAIKNVNKEIIENTQLKSRILELEALWATEFQATQVQARDDGEKAELNKQIEQSKAKVEELRALATRYRNDRDSAEKKLQEKRDILEEVYAANEELKDANEKLEDDLNAANESIKKLKAANDKLLSDLNAANKSIKQLENKNSQVTPNERIQNEIARLKENLNAKEKELGNVNTQLEWAEEEINEYKEKFENSESMCNIQSQTTLIQIQQLQQTLDCSREQNQRLQQDLVAEKELNQQREKRALALQELMQSAKECLNSQKLATKITPSKKELTEKIKEMEAEKPCLLQKITEAQNAANDYYIQWRQSCDENKKLKIDLEEAQKRRERLDRTAEKRRRSKERQQELMQQQNSESLKRARYEEMRPTTLTISPSTAQQQPIQQQPNQGPISCSPPGLSPQFSGPATQQSPGFQQVHPQLFNQLIRPPSNLNSPNQNPPSFSPQLQQQFLQQQQRQMMMLMMQQHQQRFPLNQSNSVNPLMHQQQQQLPSPNLIPEMLPSAIEQTRPQMLFSNFQQQQQQPQQMFLPMHMHPQPPRPPPPYNQ